MPKRTKRLWWESSSPEIPPVETPSCFTDQEWAAYYEAEKASVWKPKSVPKRVKGDMCSDCTIGYQQQQMQEGKCNPYYGAITPLHRLALIASGEVVDEEDDWTDLPILPREGIGFGTNGSGQEKPTTDENDDLVLS
jgi:hypothetical protein